MCLVTFFRYFLLCLITFFSMVLYSLITFLKRGFTNLVTQQMSEFPHRQLALMGLLDSVQFGGLVVTASGVTPTMTVILLHASTPLIVFGSRYLFPERQYSQLQVKGSSIILTAIAISTLRPLFYLIQKTEISEALSSLLFVISAFLQGISTIYKEKCILEWGKPMDLHFLSSWIFCYQFLFCLLLAPIFYYLQNVSVDDGPGFPMSSFIPNMRDGWQCFRGQDPPLVFFLSSPSPDSFYDPSYTDCSSAWWLVLGFVLANVFVVEAVDRVCQLSDQLVGRAMTVAVFSSFVALGVYDHRTNDGYALWGTSIGITDILALGALLVGLEIYGRDPEPESEAITNYYSQVPLTSLALTPSP